MSLPLSDFERDPEYTELMDAGKRIADEYVMHRLADPIGNLGYFFAVRLQDATSNHVLYPSMDAARRDIGRRDDEDRWFYIQIVPTQLPPRDAALLLRAQRKMYAKGIRVSSMDGRVMIPRITREDFASQVRSILHGTRPTNVKGF
jgi:hypothetical protein